MALLVVAAAGYGVTAARRPLPKIDGGLAVAALAAPVDVYRDAFGVPHVYADSVPDLFVAQGFIHAQDRFWEMDVRRHSTAGRLAELFGPSQVDTDRFIRTLGWRRVAEREWDLLAPETQRIFRAYARGVNAYLEDRPTGRLALEYAVLGLQRPGYDPEPWSPIDSLAWLKAMAWDLRANMEDEIRRVALTERLPSDRIDQLWPPYPYDLRPPIVAAEDVRAASASDVDPAVAAARPLLAQVARRVASLPTLLGPAGSGIGSNSFVVSGERTATGLPLLANDPHLAPTLPSLWYQMALHCRRLSDHCPYAVSGFTFSGLPGVVIGHNNRIAWGFTNMGADVSDLVLERVTDDHYEHAGQIRPLARRTETIRVAGGDDVTVTVRETGHGPLISDASESFQTLAAQAPAAAERQELAVALRWTALRPGRTADAIPAMNTAQTWEEFRAAAAAFEVPAQNLVYADVDGNIGYQAPGAIPRRAAGDDGRWPVAGWTGERDWQGMVDFEDLPTLLNPAEGFIVAANQPVIPEGSGPFFSRDHDYGWRSQRLRTLLQDARNLRPDDLLALQQDAANPLAETLVPLLRRLTVPAEVRPARDLLDQWDYQMTPDSAAGAYFAGVWRHLLLRTFGDDLPKDAAIDGGGRWMEVIRVLAEQPDALWWDDRKTRRREGRDDMLRAALVDAHAELTARLGAAPAQWQWGTLHTLTLRHQTLGSSGIAPLERIFNRGPLHLGGGPSIVNANAWDAKVGYEVNWVPSMRMVVDLFDLDAARWSQLTGQSGHVWSSHYTDQTSRWATGRTLPMRWSLQAVRAAATAHLRLVP